MAYRTRAVLLSHPNLAPDLRTRLEQCGSPASWGWQFCRAAACDRCRRHRARAWADEAVAAFGECRNRDLLQISITLTPAPGVVQMRRELSRTRKAMRNLMARIRGKDARADDVRMIGAFTFDWLGVSGEWQPRLDLMVDLVGLAEWKLRDGLNRQWPGLVSTTTMPVESRADIQEETARWLDFSHQSRWPPDRLLDFHHAAHGAHGFSLSRFHLRPAMEWIEVEEEEENYGAMPTVIGSADFNPFRKLV